MSHRNTSISAGKGDHTFSAFRQVKGERAFKLLLLIVCFFVLAGSITAIPARAAEEETNQGKTESIQKAQGEETLQLSVGHSRNLKTPWPVKRVSVANPDVANVKVLTPNQILVMAKAVGTTDLLMWNEKEEVLQMKVDVGLDLTEIRARMKNLFPKAQLKVTRSQGTILVKGTLSNASSAAKLREYFDSLKVEYVDMTRMAGPQQVMLKVRVAEVSKTALKEMSISLFHTSSNFFGGTQVGSSGGAFNPVSIGPPSGASVTGRLPFEFTEDVTVGSGATMFMGFPRAELETFVRALAENEYLRLLAEPNLVTKSGEEATFLAGGEFPIPVVQSVGGGGAGGGTAISIEWKEFGVRLRFRPQVLGEGTIRLRVVPEVSTLSDVGSVTVQGITVPSLIVRRADATLELKSGETFAMAGLLSETTTARNSRVPGLGQLPVIGALFRSIRYQKEETELVVLVTASLVRPLRRGMDLPVPGVLHTPPNDWDLFVRGKIEGTVPPKLSPTDAKHLKELGLDDVVGPGGWQTYTSPGVRSRASTRSKYTRDSEDKAQKSAKPNTSGIESE